MASVNLKALQQYLRDNPGTAALRALREEAIRAGVPLDTLRPPPQRQWPMSPEPQSAKPAALRAATDSLRTFASSNQYSLSYVPKVVAGAAQRAFAACADSDGNVTRDSVVRTLGLGGERLFDLVAASMQKARAPSAPVKMELPANALGTRVRSALSRVLKVPAALSRRVHWQLRLTDLNEYAKLRQALEARDVRRDPARRLAEALLQPKQVAPVTASMARLTQRAREEQPFKGAKLLCLQHLYPSTQGILELCVAGGLAPEDATVFGKSYSGALRTAAAIVHNRHRLVVPSLAQSETEDNEAYSRALIDEQVGALLAEGGDGPIFVLDDGGQIARVIKERYPEAMHRFRFVEQTQHGVDVLRKLGIEAVWIPVGDDPVKKEFETPSVARCVVRTLTERFASLANVGVFMPRVAALLGLGSVGGQVASQLSSAGWEVHGWDPNEEKRRTAPPSCKIYDRKSEALAHGHFCLGASGSVSLELDEVPFLPKHAVVGSLSSGNHEQSAASLLTLQLLGGCDLSSLIEPREDGFSIRREGFFAMDTAVLDEEARLWDFFQGRQVCLGKDDSTTQRDRVVHTADGQDLYFIHSGFVMNFHEGPEDPIPPRYFVTQPLLAAALLQVAKSTGKGEERLDPVEARLILGEYERELARTGESLLKPTF